MTGRYRELPPPRDLAGLVACGWERPAGGGTEVLVLPDGCVDVVAGSDGRLFVAGPDLGPVVSRQDPGVALVGVRLRAGVAGTVLGVPVDALRDQRVDLAELWGSPARVTGERIAMASGDARLATLAGAIRGHTGAVSGTVGRDRAVLAAVGALAATAPRVSTVAADLGLSERQLRRRFAREVGYGPKAFAGVVRFRRFLAAGAGVAAGRATLADAAAAAGYADQAHLVRDCRRLAGRTPSEVVTAWWGPPGGRAVAGTSKTAG